MSSMMSSTPSRLLPRWGAADALLLSVCLVAAGAWSVAAGTDRNWDLQNYHLYAPHAWLHGRLFRDVAAGQMQSYFNPLLHMPWYAAFWLLMDWPRVFAFLSGLPAGLLAFLYLRIAHAHAATLLSSPSAQLAATAALGAMGLTGAAFVPAIGLSSGDIWVAAPLMGAYGLVLRGATRRDAGQAPDLRAMALAGLLAGLATGLKLTSLPFAAAIGLMLLATLGLRAAIVAGMAMGVGFVAGWGPHALTLWQETGNPTFPLNNHVFLSPDWLAQPLLDERFLPRSLLQAIFYPFWWLETNSNLVSELRMRDWRLAMAYVAAPLVLVGLLRGAGGRGARPAWLLLGTCALSYGGWVILFGIYRYLVFLEMLAAPLVLTALALLLPRRETVVVLAMWLAATLAMATTLHMNWGHGRHGARLLEVPALPVGAESLVVTSDDDPYGYLVPFLPPEVTVLGLRTNFFPPGQEHGLARRIRQRLSAHAGPIWVIHAPGNEARRDAVLAAYGLAVSGPCQPVRTSMARHSFCPARKLD